MQIPVPEKMTDRRLVEAAQGDAAAWRQLVEAYTPRVFGLLVKQCGDRELAEEITQATFVKIVTHLGKYEEKGQFESWLFRIAMNRLRDEMRRRKRHAKPMDMTPGAAAGGSGETQSSGLWAAHEHKIVGKNSHENRTPLEQMTHMEQLDQVRQAVARLSEADRDIIYMRHTAGLTFAQIAQALDQPLGTVLARGHRALAKLKTQLRGEMDEA